MKPSESTGATEQPSHDGRIAVGPDETGTYPNGYRFPKKHTWKQSVAIGSKAFFRFACTPFGFIITIYGLNVVGWGEWTAGNANTLTDQVYHRRHDLFRAAECCPSNVSAFMQC